MKILLSPRLLELFPSIEYSVILVQDIDNSRKISTLAQMLRGAAVIARNNLRKVEKKDLFVRITENYTEQGFTPLEGYLMDNRFKKIQGNKEIEENDNLSNFLNYLSLRYFLPLHAVDLDQMGEDIALDVIKPKKGKKAPEMSFYGESNIVAIWFPNLARISEEETTEIITYLNDCLTKYFQTQIADIYQLNAENTAVDLNYQSELELKNKLQERENLKNSQRKNAGQMIGNKNQGIIPVKDEEVRTVYATDAASLIKGLLNDIVKDVLNENVPLSEQQEMAIDIEIEIPKEKEHGDLSTNLAMRLAKTLNMSPHQIAEKLLELIEKEHPDFVKKIEILGPGFINFHLKTEYFTEKLKEILLLEKEYGRLDIGKNQSIMIDFGSLNIAKPFGAHHFMTTVIGQTLVNLYKVIGYHVLAVDFPGDWGTQFGKSIYAFKNWGDKGVIEKDPMNELLKLYVKFHEEAEKDPSLEDAARAEFKKLEDGDPENVSLWQWIVDVSIRDIDQIYKTLGVKHDLRYPESKYNQSSKDMLELGKQNGIIVEGEKGAFIVQFDEEKMPPALVQKSDGTTLYITRDLASIKDRLETQKNIKKMIYVVDIAQTLHFRQLFAMVTKIHEKVADFPITEFKHVPYGRMSFADLSMSTRKGNIILGREMIEEARKKAELIVNEKTASNSEISEGQKQKLINGIALGAIKYAMICQAPESDFVFDWNKVISLDGNCAPYLQYTLARAYSIIRKSADQEETVKPEPPKKTSTSEQILKKISEDQIDLFSMEQAKLKKMEEESAAAAESQLSLYSNPAEQQLLRQLVQFPTKIAAAAESYKPNTLTNYLYDLAQSFNTFYSAVSVNKTQRQDLRESRENLVKASIIVLKNGLEILGIESFESM